MNHDQTTLLFIGFLRTYAAERADKKIVTGGDMVNSCMVPSH